MCYTSLLNASQKWWLSVLQLGPTTDLFTYYNITQPTFLVLENHVTLITLNHQISIISLKPQNIFQLHWMFKKQNQNVPCVTRPTTNNIQYQANLWLHKSGVWHEWQFRKGAKNSKTRKTTNRNFLAPGMFSCHCGPHIIDVDWDPDKFIQRNLRIKTRMTSRNLFYAYMTESIVWVVKPFRN